MFIYIPSRGRAQAVETLDALPSRWLASTWLVVPPAEEAAYRRRHPQVLAPDVQGIGPVRQWILEQHPDPAPLLMLDDDLSFHVRRQLRPPRLRPATSADMEDLFAAAHQMLAAAPLVGVSFRQHNDKTPQWFRYNARVDRAFFIAPFWLRSIPCPARFDRVPLMENFDFALQVLRAGCPTAVLYHWAQDQTASNAPGGCSTYRTADLQAQAATQLAQLHPTFVRQVTRTTAGGWEGMREARPEAVCQWQRAYLSTNPRRRLPAFPLPVPVTDARA